MSTPVPEFPDVAVSSPTFTFGGYATEPGGLAGVSFWPRLAARVIDLVVHYCVSFAAGIFFTILLAAASGGHIPFWVMVKLRHAGVPGIRSQLAWLLRLSGGWGERPREHIGQAGALDGSGAGRRHTLPL